MPRCEQAGRHSGLRAVAHHWVAVLGLLVAFAVRLSGQGAAVVAGRDTHQEDGGWSWTVVVSVQRLVWRHSARGFGTRSDG